MSTFSHHLNAGYDSIEQAIAVTIPADVLAEALLPTADHFDRLKTSVEDADITRAGIEQMSPSHRHEVHDGTVAVLAANLGGVEVTLTPQALLAFTHELLAVAVDHSVVGRTALPDLKAAANLVGRVLQDEARSDAIRDRSTRTAPRRLHPVAAPVRVA